MNSSYRYIHLYSPPIIWSDPQNPEEVEAGYGFISDETTEEETFFYHSDHLGSTSYITDDRGNITQYTAYLPYGELLVDEHSSSEDLPYKFNGKELDEETGLYYYGARYLNPISSVWYGLDPLFEKYPEVSAYVYCHGNSMNRIDPDGKTDYYTQNGNFIKRIDDGKNIKIMLFITSKKEAKVKEAIDKKHYIIVPSNEVVNTMDEAYKLTEENGYEHGFRVGQKGNISIIVKGNERFIDGNAWLPAVDDLRDRGDYVAYDVHTHPKPRYDGGLEIPFNNLPSDTDLKNIVGDQPNVVLGYNFTTSQSANQIGGNPIVTYDRFIRFFDKNGSINSEKHKFSDFKRSVNKINKDER